MVSRLSLSPSFSIPLGCQIAHSKQVQGLSLLSQWNRYPKWEKGFLHMKKNPRRIYLWLTALLMPRYGRNDRPISSIWKTDRQSLRGRSAQTLNDSIVRATHHHRWNVMTGTPLAGRETSGTGYWRPSEQDCPNTIT